jgi:hypothetical protein
MDNNEQIRNGLNALRQPFAPHHIGKLPKPTKAQTDAVKADFSKGIRCNLCNAWHHPQVVHLDYVGHAAITDRLLEVDPSWYWEPLAYDSKGLPAKDDNGGLWIKLTILGVTRLGYGDATGKNGGDAVKELIGDALRNAAMRFGCALDLWHKGDLHLPKEEDNSSQPLNAVPKENIADSRLAAAIAKIKSGEYTKERLLSSFVLTESQLKVLNDQVQS